MKKIFIDIFCSFILNEPKRRAVRDILKNHHRPVIKNKAVESDDDELNKLLRIVKKYMPDMDLTTLKDIKRSSSPILCINGMVCKFKNETAVIREELALKIIADNIHSVATPIVKAFLNGGDSFVCYKFIEGKNYCFLYTPPTFSHYIRITDNMSFASHMKIANFLAELHSIDIDKLSEDAKVIFNESSSPWVRQIDKDGRIKLAKAFGSEVLTILNYSDELLLQRNDKVLIHGDFGIGNIIGTETDISGVIDFDCAQFSDRLFDFSILAYASIITDGQIDIRIILNEYNNLTNAGITERDVLLITARHLSVYLLNVWGAGLENCYSRIKALEYIIERIKI